ncbi:hypothetical protein [Wolbachia endosymbiont (group A) of Tiphia femorata]|nr:hypothetical protein [Wolbachia endosymbiont (group A) of Tiphia femorata]
MSVATSFFGCYATKPSQCLGTGITPLTMYLNYNVHHYTLAGCHI